MFDRQERPIEFVKKRSKRRLLGQRDVGLRVVLVRVDAKVNVGSWNYETRWQ